MAIDATVTDIVQEVVDSRVDMQSFASFMFEPADVMISRRLAPDTHSLTHYLDYLDAIKLVFTQETGDVAVGDKTIKTVSQSIADAVDIIIKSGGHVGYLTLAAANADKANITAKTVVEITNDSDTTKNGLYLYDGSTFTKSAYDPLTLAKADATNKADAAKTQANSYTDSKVAKINTQLRDQLITESQAEMADFFGDYQNGTYIDSASVNNEVMTVSNGVKTYQSFDDAYPNVLRSPKIVVNELGEYSWSPHNILKVTDDLTNSVWSKLGMTVDANQQSVNGDLSAFKVVATSQTGSITQYFSDFIAQAHRIFSIIIKPLGDTTHASLIVINNSSETIFDLVNKTVVSLGDADDAKLVDLGNGYLKLIAASKNNTTARFGVGLSDNPSKIASKTGLSAIIECLQLNFGGIALDYVENTTTTSPKCLASFDYSKGERTFLAETFRDYKGLWSDDLTQSAWVKTNVTATQTAVSPLNTPCSTLTSNAIDSTVLQTVTITALTFSVFIKRVTGTGAISLTLDNGVTWQDVSAEINSNGFSRVVIGGSGKTYGFKFASAGDAISVCLANVSANYNALTPYPYFSTTADVDGDLSITIPSGNELTTYYKFHYPKIVSDYNKATPVSFTGLNTNSFNPYAGSGLNVLYTLNQGDGASTIISNQAKTNASSVVEVTALASYAESRYEISANGDYSVPIVGRSRPNLATANLFGSKTGTYHLSKFLLVKEAIKDFDIHDWRFSKAIYNEGLINVATVTKQAQFADTTWNREPVIFILDDDNERVDMLIVHMNRYITGFHPEAPARLMQRKLRYYKDSNRFVYLTPNEVFYEHEGWSEGRGHLQSATISRVKSGEYAGRLVALFNKADSENETFLDRNVYRMFNDSNGDANAWTAPEKVIDSQAVFGKETAIICPDGSNVVLFANHLLYPNRIITLVYNANWFCAIYSDDNGVTWQRGADTTLSTLSEPTISLLPNGDLVANFRTSTANTRMTFTSSDSGQTWVNIGNMINFSGTDVSGSFVNMDASGVEPNNINGEPYLVIGGYSDVSGRDGLAVHKIAQDLRTIDNTFFPIDKAKFVGYSSSKPIFNNEYLAVAFEGGTAKGLDHSCFVAIVKVK